MKKLRETLRKKLEVLQGNPRRIARSFALGTFMGVTPFIGMQIMISVLLSWLLNLSKAAAITGVVNTNWTKGVLVYPLNYKLGAFLLGMDPLLPAPGGMKDLAFRNLAEGGLDIFTALLLGGILTGSLLALFYYHLVMRLLRNEKLPECTGKTHDQSDIQPYALITGASQGLGKAMALELAKRNHPLLLVSLKDEGLPALCEQLRTDHGIDAQYLETDLSARESVYEVAEWVSKKYPLFALINNAGLGGTQAFDAASPEYVDTIIQVNVRATSLLTRLLLPELKKQKKAYIMNVASMASFSPFAYKTVYPASKAFVYSFSRGLHEELRGSGVHVCVIHPGPMKTNADVSWRIEKQGVFGKMGLLSPEKTAHIAIRQMLKRDSLVLPGVFNKINWLFMMLIPNAWKLPILSRVVKNEIVQKLGNQAILKGSPAIYGH